MKVPAAMSAFECPAPMSRNICRAMGGWFRRRERPENVTRMRVRPPQFEGLTRFRASSAELLRGSAEGGGPEAEISFAAALIFSLAATCWS